MNTTTIKTASYSHIDSIRATYAENTAAVKKILDLSEEKYFEIVSGLGFRFLEKYQFFDELKANPLFWNWLRMKVGKAERIFLNRFQEPERRQTLFISYTCIIEFQVLNNSNTKADFEAFLKILRNENLR